MQELGELSVKKSSWLKGQDIILDKEVRFSLFAGRQ